MLNSQGIIKRRPWRGFALAGPRIYCRSRGSYSRYESVTPFRAKAINVTTPGGAQRLVLLGEDAGDRGAEATKCERGWLAKQRQRWTEGTMRWIIASETICSFHGRLSPQSVDRAGGRLGWMDVRAIRGAIGGGQWTPSTRLRVIRSLILDSQNYLGGCKR